MVGTRSTARPGPAKKPPENERPAPTKNVRFEQAKERFDGVHLKYRPPAKRPTIEKSKHPEKPETTEPTAAKTNTEGEEELTRKEPSVPWYSLPAAPYRFVRDANLPEKPVRKSTGPAAQDPETGSELQDEPIPIPKDGAAYSNKAPVEDQAAVEKLAKWIMDAGVVTSVSELLSVSKSVRDEVHRVLTKRRVPLSSKQVLVLDFVDQMGTEEPHQEPEESEKTTETLPMENEIPDETSESPWMVNSLLVEELPPAVVLNQLSIQPYGNGVCIGDPILQYLESLAPGEKPKPVVVARDTASIRAIRPLINGKLHVESIHDSGSQIVSTSRKVAEELGLSWDPEVCIYMQSTNGQVEKSLGIARNVAFNFDGITLYMQVHIIKEPAYEMLLGRPFDLLTKSVIENESDGSQRITVTCPNTNRKVTMPTFARGKSRPLAVKDPPAERESLKSMEDFPATLRN